MDKDYRIGLIAGLVLVIAAMIWVATRPSLSPEARLLGPGTASSSSHPATRLANEGTASRDTLPPGLVAVEPEPSTPGPIAPALERPRTYPSATAAPNYPDLTIYEQDEKIKTTKFHIVRKNETLSAISQQHYGTANNWQKILRANSDIIKDANRITPGTKLIIPD